ncbi:MAG: long-chain fatty acid--CoA ligase [Candidatus Accumulibacter sp.]|nr:long-chain fatty acid--CoA ligase [Accumulibacter sp.]
MPRAGPPLPPSRFRAKTLPYLLVLTSGATGNPKPIVLSQHTKCLRAEAAAGLYGVNADDVIMAATPLYHSLAQRLVLMSLISGGTSVLMAHFSPAAWIENASRHSSQLHRGLLAAEADSESPGQHGESLPSLRCLVSSSAVLDEETKRQLLARLKGEFHECYGTSEIAIATNLTPTAARRKLGSVGMAIPGTELMILGDDGKQAPTGTAGEILCRTPMLYSGYYGQAQSTTAARWGDFFRTGDLGTMDDEGFPYFRGRIKDIITGGVNAYPKDIEEVIANHPGSGNVPPFPCSTTIWVKSPGWSSLSMTPPIRPACATSSACACNAWGTFNNLVASSSLPTCRRTAWVKWTNRPCARPIAGR